MRITTTRQRLPINDYDVEACRNRDGVMQLWTGDEKAYAAALGFVHVCDRQVEMMLVRLVGQGRLSECLQSDDETLAIDTFSREMGFDRDAALEVKECSAETLIFAEAYAAGVNAGLQRFRRPLEFVLTSYRPEPWSVTDTLAIIKVMTYVGLGQTQQDLEKLLVEAIRGGVPLDRLKKLVAPHLDDLDDATIDAIRNLREVQPVMPPEVRFHPGMIGPRASNNWVVAGDRSATGTPLFCCDPHMEVNRLPALWYEVVAHFPDDLRVGITMPGAPVMIMGRTRNLAFSFTYGFMDMVDYFIEDVRDGRCRRGDRHVPFEIHQETIQRKGDAPVVLTIRENNLGMLEADPVRQKLDDGLYLTRAWSAQRNGAAASLESMYRLPAARTVPEGQEVLREATISCNWVLADSQGNIGYQQSGRAPVRRHSGMFPVPAWDEKFAWNGWVPPQDLHSALNPPAGYIVTANDEINPPGGPTVVNLPMGSYRVDRIRSALATNDKATIDDMKRLQRDLYSLQAERLLAVLDPVLPDSPATLALRKWDRRYDRGSRAATIFEDLYSALLRKVFGEGFFGEAAWDAVVQTTCVLGDFYHLFDNVLLGDDPAWFGEAGKLAVCGSVARDVLTNLDPTTVPTWGERQRLMMTNIFFAGKLPLWLGFDRGPIELEGNRATVVQGGVLRSHGRLTTFAPSWRMVTDLASDEAFTVLPGGPSGSRFSKYYFSEVQRWLDGEYKVLGPEE